MSLPTMPLRFVGIRHRRKKTAKGEARPTTVAIMIDGKLITCWDLETETSELDWLLHRFPVEWKKAGDEDVKWFDPKDPVGTMNGIRPHHCKWRKVKKDEATTVKANHIRTIMDKKGMPVQQRLLKVPVRFEGLREGDAVAMVLGGSGDRFASALSRHGEEVGAKVYRIPPFNLQEQRELLLPGIRDSMTTFSSAAAEETDEEAGDESEENGISEHADDKDVDHVVLATALQRRDDLFYHLGPKDRQIIRVKEALSLRMDAQRSRIGCEQRILQALVGKIFLSEEGRYPEGLIEDQCDDVKANDNILKGLTEEEEKRDRELKKTVHSLEVWQQVFGPVTGCGERIAAALISAVGDIRRFAVPVNHDGANSDEERLIITRRAISKSLAKVKAQCGAHILADGTFPRRRAGQVANWSPLARQALFLLVDQFNRQSKKYEAAVAADNEAEKQKYYWGGKLLAQKATYRQTHPEPVTVEKGGRKVKMYTNGHIHKMALKHTATKFVEWFARKWLQLEGVYNTTAKV